jgi:hypothetical protein
VENKIPIAAIMFLNEASHKFYDKITLVVGFFGSVAVGA